MFLSGTVIITRRITIHRLSFNFSQTSDRVRLHVQLSRELKVIIELDCTLTLEIVVETFQLNHQNWRQLFDAKSFRRIDFFVATFAVVGVAAVQQLALDVLVKRVGQVGVVFHVHADHTEGLLARIAMRAGRKCDKNGC